MRTFAQRPSTTRQVTSPGTAVRARSHFGHGHEATSLLHPEHTVAGSPPFGHDFGRIPVRPPPPVQIQKKLAISWPGDEYEQEADRVAEQVMRMPEPQSQRTAGAGGGCPACQADQPGLPYERLQTKRVSAENTGRG